MVVQWLAMSLHSTPLSVCILHVLPRHPECRRSGDRKWMVKWHLPKTTRWVIASVVPHSFLILILISPEHLRLHLVSTRRVCSEDFSILMLVSSTSSSPSWYHCTFMGWRPMNVILNTASFPLLISIGFLNSSTSSAFSLGGSSESFRKNYRILMQKNKALHGIIFFFSFFSIPNL